MRVIEGRVEGEKMIPMEIVGVSRMSQLFQNDSNSNGYCRCFIDVATVSHFVAVGAQRGTR